jgi:hypothetical protein
MGSGRSGAGGGGGGGGTTLNLPTSWSGPVSTRKAVPKSKVDLEIHRILSRLPKEYLNRQFGSSMTRGIYEQLFSLNIHVFQNRSWAGIADTYGVVGGNGCLRNWASRVANRYEAAEVDQKVRETAQETLQEFLLLALKGDDATYFDGPSDRIISKLNRKTFSSTSGYFLGILIWRILERQGEPLSEDVQVQLQELAQAKADQIIQKFEGKFLHKPHGEKLITYQDLFLIIQENMPWFIEELRR